MHKQMTEIVTMAAAIVLTGAPARAVTQYVSNNGNAGNDGVSWATANK